MDTDLILKTIDQDIAMHQAYASYWQAMAITGVAKNRKLLHGTAGPAFTDKEKIADAMDTAKIHLRNMSKLIDKKKSIWAEVF